MLKWSSLAALTALVAIAAACASSGAGGRKVAITQSTDGCVPASVSVTAGEKLQLVVKNESKSDYEVEGIDGTKVEEVIVPAGRTRNVGFTVPSSGAAQHVKCYVPAGVATIIEFVSSDAASAPATGSAATAQPTAPHTPATLRQPDATVAVTLADYTVTTDKASVKAGAIRFIATNASSDQTHELYVMRRKTDGTLEKIDEVESIQPAHGGTLTLDLKPGSYVLACLIAKGENGSPVDHYQQGMHTNFTVE
jgi:uncharacterized cupredoxin-like copper-binding protein